jgi:hypothetical protein
MSIVNLSPTNNLAHSEINPLTCEQLNADDRSQQQSRKGNKKRRSGGMLSQSLLGFGAGAGLGVKNKINSRTNSNKSKSFKLYTHHYLFML